MSYEIFKRIAVEECNRRSREYGYFIFNNYDGSVVDWFYLKELAPDKGYGIKTIDAQLHCDGGAFMSLKEAKKVVDILGEM